MPNYRKVVLDVISAIGGDVSVWQLKTCEKQIDNAITVLVDAFGKHCPGPGRINLLAHLIQQNYPKWEEDAGQTAQQEQDARAGEDELHAKILACIQKTLGIGLE
jgi:hypothetical protein